MATDDCEAPSLLLALPDDCLLPILQYCAANGQHSLFSAARAHSRLHQAAVAALRSITAPVTRQQQLDSVLLYLSKHGDHTNSVEFKGDGDYRATLRQLPQHLQLSSFHLSDVQVQLLPGNGFQGVLSATAQQAPLKQLRLDSCMLLDSVSGGELAAALTVLPAGLEHLSICNLRCNGEIVQFPTAILQQLQQLTYLELADVSVLGPGKASPVLQPLQALTRLQHLCLHSVRTEEDGGMVAAAILSGPTHLTHLQLSAGLGLFDDEAVWNVEPGVLAGKTRLQHLHLAQCNIVGGAAGIAQLLCGLQQLQQLTYLNLSYSLEAHNHYDDRVQDPDSTPPAAAYAALTASSNLQQLDITGAVLPEGVWQHIFPAGRQRAHLRSLDISHVQHQDGTAAAAPEGSRLVSCCPGLQSINMQQLQYSEELLDSVQGLSGLHTLHLGMSRHSEAPVSLEGVRHLTGLRMLRVVLPATAKEGLLLQLTALKQLDTLIYRGPTGCTAGMVCLSQVGWGVGCFPCLLMIASSHGRQHQALLAPCRQLLGVNAWHAHTQ